jgi:uncharacterized lipoprotein YddW (UPF0748 family)
VADADIVREYGQFLWFDPGELKAADRFIDVLVDVVTRYDIDGVHIDDYFYPYKERNRRGVLIDFPDADTYLRYVRGGGKLERDDWRRENVNTLVRELYASIHAEKPWVKFGVSPFGIWRPGFPESVVGFDAYTELYADARKWLQEGWLDYFSPQLYWPVGQVGQDYPVLLRWWSEQNAFGRHLWPGNYASKVGERSRTAWRSAEIESQITATRAQTGASGNVHFSATAFLQDRDSLATRLSRSVYDALALVPASPWMTVPPQGAPQISVVRAMASGAWTVTLTPTAETQPQWWLVQTRNLEGTWRSTLMSGALQRITVPASADRVAVRAVDRAAVESPAVVVKLQ